MFLVLVGVTGVVDKRLGMPDTPHRRAKVYAQLRDESDTVLEPYLRSIASSADAKRLGPGGGAYALGCVQ